MPAPTVDGLLALALEHLWSDPVGAQNLAEQAIASSDAASDAARARWVLARALVQRGEYRQAITQVQAALPAPSDALEAALQLELGTAHANLGEVEVAFTAHARAHHLYRLLNDPVGLARTLHNVGSGFRELHDFAQAENHLQEALRLFVEHADVPGEAMTWVTLGLVANEQGNAVLALERVQAGLQRAMQAGDVRQQALALINLGWASLLAQQMTTADHLLQQALELARLPQVQSRHYEALALGLIGMLKNASGDVAGAIADLHTALGFAEALELTRGELIVHQELVHLYEVNGDHANALKHYKRYHELERRVLAGQAEQHVRAIGARFEAEAAQQAARELEEAYAKLRQQTEELDRLSREDALTGLANRRQLDERLAVIFAEARDQGRPLSVVVGDIDSFKRINDQCSHAVGDAVLKRVAEIIRGSARASDLTARYGGEEFVLVLDGAPERRSLEVAECIRNRVADFDWSSIHPALQVTISLGVACDASLEHHERLIAVADARMYAAKRDGKNRVYGSAAEVS